MFILYRRSRAEMPAALEEIEEAEEEGIKMNFLVAPVRVVGENGKVTASSASAWSWASPMHPAGAARSR